MLAKRGRCAEITQIVGTKLTLDSDFCGYLKGENKELKNERISVIQHPCGA
jgi:hypothetical protein